MTQDPRLTPANARVAARHLQGQVEATTFVDPTPARAAWTVVDLGPETIARRDRQLVFGDVVDVYERRQGRAFVQSRKDGYVGYIPEGDLGPLQEPTHFVSSAGTHVYASQSMKSPDLMPLTLGSQVQVTAELHKFWETPDGFIPKKHLRPLDQPFTDPATVAQALFGTPYLWGGNSRAGIDCSGLIQAALLACNIPCPGDSDMQHQSLGTLIPDGTPPLRNDLYFWKGHVGIMVDDTTLLHANAHHMAVTYEPIMQAILRIEAQGSGPVLARKRL